MPYKRGYKLTKGGLEVVLEDGVKTTPDEVSKTEVAKLSTVSVINDFGNSVNA